MNDEIIIISRMSTEAKQNNDYSAINGYSASLMHNPDNSVLVAFLRNCHTFKDKIAMYNEILELATLNADEPKKTLRGLSPYVPHET